MFKVINKRNVSYNYKILDIRCWYRNDYLDIWLYEKSKM